MALYWKWDEKCGELLIDRIDPQTGEVEEDLITLYQGNAYLIMLKEFVEDGEEKYLMWSFFADKEHMDSCLGLKEGCDNILDDSFLKIKKLKLIKSKNQHTTEIINAFANAFDEIEIEVIK